MDARPFLVFFTLCAVAAPWSALRRHADEVQTLEAIMDDDSKDVGVEEDSSKKGSSKDGVIVANEEKQKEDRRKKPHTHKKHTK